MFRYPWGDFHSLNLGWFLLQFKDWVEKIQEYLDNGGGTSENLANVIAPVFNAANTYQTGDYVLYNNELYKANQAVAPGTWNPDNWTQCLIVDEMGSSGGAGVDDVARLMIAGQYSASFAYQKYGICRYNDKLWMCNTDLPAGGEPWNVAHWDEITVGAGLTGLRRSVETLSQDITTLQSYITHNYRNVLKGKKLLVIGDSWCGSWNGSENLTPWATRLATLTGAICENHAFPGSGFIATGSLNKNFATAISELDGDFDAIVVQGGVNDILNSPTIETIRSAVANFATNCRTKFPNRDIYYIPTTPCVPLNITEIQVIFNIMLEARKNYLITCKETASISVSSPNYAGDLHHLSDAGYDELARCVAQFLSGGTPKVTKETIHYPNNPAYMFYNMTPPAGITWTGMYIRVEDNIVNFYGTASFANDTNGDFIKIMDGLPPAIAPYTASNYAFDTFPEGSDPAFAYRVAFVIGQRMEVQTFWTNMKNHTLLVVASYTTNENTELFTT